MSNAPALFEQLRPFFPLLRRCGRALTGDQRLADSSVIAVMDEFLATDPGHRTNGGLQIGAYRSYLAALTALRSEAGEAFADRYSPLHMQAHWLTVVEELSESETAEVLQVSLARVRELLNVYMIETATPSCASVLIIEDEALIAHDLKRVVVSMGHKVAAVARTRQAAIERYLQHRPALVLSDIRLADNSSGIEAVEIIHSVATVPVVYITAYPERLLTGTRSEPLFLINKPYDPDVVEAAVRQALYLESRRGPGSAGEWQPSRGGRHSAA
jgi:CheY-like chemotaxis protein